MINYLSLLHQEVIKQSIQWKKDQYLGQLKHLQVSLEQMKIDSKIQRLKYNNNKLNISIPGPGTYEIIDDERKNTNILKGTSSFLSHIPKIQELIIADRSPSPVSYHVDQHTIVKRIVKTEEDNPKLAVLKPPFGVGEERWKIKEESEEDDDDEPIYMNKQQINSINLFKKRKKEQPPFLTKEERFALSMPKNFQPGPSDYADGTFPHWNKRTFNLLFAEI